MNNLTSYIQSYKNTLSICLNKSLDFDIFGIRKSRFFYNIAVLY